MPCGACIKASWSEPHARHRTEGPGRPQNLVRAFAYSASAHQNNENGGRCKNWRRQAPQTATLIAPTFHHRRVTASMRIRIRPLAWTIFHKQHRTHSGKRLRQVILEREIRACPLPYAQPEGCSQSLRMINSRSPSADGFRRRSKHNCAIRALASTLCVCSRTFAKCKTTWSHWSTTVRHTYQRCPVAT